MAGQHGDNGARSAARRPEDGGSADDVAGAGADALQHPRWAAAPDLPAPGTAAGFCEEDTHHAGAIGSDPFQLRIYDPADLDRAIQAIVGADDGDEFIGPADERPAGEAELATEEKLRLRRLRALAADRRGPWRPLLRATPAMVGHLAAGQAQC